VRIVGLTGGIASGKSTVRRMFAELGAATLDADQVAREVVEPGEPALAEIVAEFGPEFLLPDGCLNRRALGDRVFAPGSAGKWDRQRLNRITHPRIGAALQEKLAQFAREGVRVVVLEAAVLKEAGWDELVDEVILVVVQPSVQAQRLIADLGLPSVQAKARVRAQRPTQMKPREAHHVLRGDRPLVEIQAQVRALWNSFQAAARSPG
jgi:dephospho-CoA kinase